MPDHRDDLLVRELRDLGNVLVTPAPSDVWPAVRARLEAKTPPVSSRAPLAASSRGWIAAAAAALLALTIAVVPPARAAVANAATALMRFAGIELDRGPGNGSLPENPSPLPGSDSAALAEARRLARFPVAVPTLLGPPDSVQVADLDATGAPRIVTLIYRGGTVRLDQFDGVLEPVFIKGINATGTVWTEVNGRLAVWVPSPHPITYIDREGVRREETARLAEATLIWQAGTVSYRLEGPLELSEALDIARSLG
jgi:hypothetical protein